MDFKEAEMLIEKCKKTLKKEISAISAARAEIGKLFKKAVIIYFENSFEKTRRH